MARDTRTLPRLVAGGFLAISLMAAPTAFADPSDMHRFEGCILEVDANRLLLMTSDVPTAFDLSRMRPSDAVLAPAECVTVRAYPGAGPERSIWFAESIVAGDEKVETTGKDVTKETTAESPTKKKKNDDD